MSDNRIASVATNSFCNLTRLSNLQLQDNLLTTLHWTVFGRGFPAWLTLALGGNPLQCTSKSLCWFRMGPVVTYYSWAGIEDKPECSEEHIRWEDFNQSCAHLSEFFQISRDAIFGVTRQGNKCIE